MLLCLLCLVKILLLNKVPSATSAKSNDSGHSDVSACSGLHRRVACTDAVRNKKDALAYRRRREPIARTILSGMKGKVDFRGLRTEDSGGAFVLFVVSTVDNLRYGISERRIIRSFRT